MLFQVSARSIVGPILVNCFFNDFFYVIETDNAHNFADDSPLSTNPTKWSNTLKQFVGKLPTNCFSVFEHFVKLALKVIMF